MISKTSRYCWPACSVVATIPPAASVPGARITGSAMPNRFIRASIRLRTLGGREFTYRASAVTDSYNGYYEIRVYAGRKLVRPCPADLLQSGNRRLFAAWLGETLGLAAERSPASGE